ncbi:hypothetical protein FJY68_02880 [candidate division WOR-3 bacterium]|uniref:T9SS type A sorting domain-containing protein n=1 Tax=candidate division WOR-3 bacterium TaxID=2052148 RepID=A0A937XEU5_UNCW3|nr:hypothetical protein [candidate division WOR-3 bacterium]
MFCIVRIVALAMVAGLGTRPAIAKPIPVMSRSGAATGTLTQTFEFKPDDFVFGRVNGFDVVTLPGHYSTSEPGYPNLPLAVYNVAIPPDAEVTGVDIVSVSTEALAGEFNIHPSQRPEILSQPSRAFVPPDARAYASSRSYPAEMVRFTRSGLMGGYRLAGVHVSPLRYTAAQKRLELVTRIKVAVRYERNRHEVLSLDKSQVDLMGRNVRPLVANPEAVANWSPATRLPVGGADGRPTMDSLFDMIVITSSARAGNFQPFVNWKTRRGIKTVVMRTESIYSSYSGRDNQEKIRNCVKDYWQNHGLKWVLIGGDDGIVPVRTCRLTVEGTTEDIASDMYYADLQHSWDSNNNDLFGEMEDSVDLFYDVLIGRTPIDNASHVATFFAKDTMFEKHQDTTRLKRVLYGSTMLFDPYHGKVINHIIADEFPSGWTHAHLEDPNTGVYADSMSSGFQLAHVSAHGNPSTFSVMDDYEVAGLTNGLTRLNFVNSIACMSGWFDNDECLAEALVKAPNGGCVACMLNSRYGFGYPPAIGPSELLDLQFYRYFLQGAATQFGTLGMMSKDYFRSLAMDQEVWRWCVFELNLFGDPTLHVWSEKPGTLAVTKPDSVPTGTQVVRITVKNGSTPVKGALVCLSKGTETYARGWTNSQGWVDLLVAPTTTGNLDLSASAQNFYPYDGLVPVRGSSNRPALVFAGLRIDDSNGRLDPGETVDLYVSVKNEGAVAATGTNAVLRTFCPYVTRVDSTSSYGTIAAGATVEGDRFRVTASDTTPPGTLAEMIAACTATQGYWEPFFETRIGDLPPARKLWADHGNNDMILSVTSLGSIGTLGPYNEGSGLKYPRNAPYGSIYFTSFACGNGPNYVVDRWYGHPSSTFQADWRAVDTLHAVIPPLTGGQEYQAVIDDSAHATPKGLTVAQWSASVPDSGFRDFVVLTYRVDNLGSAPVNGVHAGIFSDFDVNNETSNDVYTDTLRRFTYMTQSGDYNYAVGIKLLSPQVAANLSAIDHNVYLVPSGMITEAVKDSFLRGAISRPNSNGSRNWSCMVSAGPFDLEVQGRAFVAFAFVGGNSEQELLDHADSAQSWFDRSVAVSGPVNVGDIMRVGLQAAPSLVRDQARLRFALPQDGRIRLSVLDVSGRTLRVLADGFYRRGAYSTTWDGRSAAGATASNGVYVYRLETSAGTANSKSVMFR